MRTQGYFHQILPPFLVGALLASGAWALVLYLQSRAIGAGTLDAAARVAGIELTRAERTQMLNGVRSNLERYDALRDVELANSILPSLLFNPLVPGMALERKQEPIEWELPANVDMPADREALAFFSITELAALIRSRQLTSLELTQMFLQRIRRHDPQLQSVITLTEDLALAQAARADEEIAAGNYRGPLHGIPYGSKDLLALEGYPTTWGAVPYQNQVIQDTATVIERLEQAGAVHLAKLSLGALAWGDIWFGGTTRSPWNTELGASGSSAGPAAALAGGLAAFTIGSETHGSIVSPASRNGVTGLRPSYGRVSRHGAMALSWSMDKLGPMTRTAEDAAIVFQAIAGPDPLDPAALDLPFNYDGQLDFSELRIGVPEQAFAQPYPGHEQDLATLDWLEKMGATLQPITLPTLPASAISLMLDVESAAAFDELTRSGRDDLMVRQIVDAWPNAFRTARTIPAVEYVQASRARTLLQQQLHAAIQEVDLYIAPSFHDNLLITNLTGHPAVVIPNGFDASGMPTSITLTGRLFDEATILAVARAWQAATSFHKEVPPGFAPSAKP